MLESDDLGPEMMGLFDIPHIEHEVIDPTRRNRLLGHRFSSRCEMLFSVAELADIGLYHAGVQSTLRIEIAKLAFEDLAAGLARQRVEKLDVFRHLEIGEASAQEI